MAKMGLAGEDVSVWVYEGNLKVEYQATALALYELSIEKDTGKIAKVTSARRLETHFRSAQLDLWQISDTEWLLALRRPEPAARKKAGKIVSLVEQLVLPEFGATGNTAIKAERQKRSNDYGLYSSRWRHFC